MTRAVALAAILLATACGGGDADTNSGVTAEEAAALNETDNMLNVEPDSLTASEDAPLGNGEVPMDDVGGETGELPVTGNEATNAQ